MIPLASSFFRINVLIIYSNDSDKFHRSVRTKVKQRFLEIVRLLKKISGRRRVTAYKAFFFKSRALSHKIGIELSICKCFNE